MELGWTWTWGLYLPLCLRRVDCVITYYFNFMFVLVCFVRLLEGGVAFKRRVVGFGSCLFGFYLVGCLLRYVRYAF